VTQFEVAGFELVDWQRDAVEAWKTARPRPHAGTLEIFTGGGKSLVALACAAEAARLDPDLRIAIVVPTEALARQWIDVVGKFTNVPASEVGLLGAGGKASLVDHRVLVAVLNTAAKQLPAQAVSGQPLMLIVDECHRAGAPTFSKVLGTKANYRLGLSATPEREELDEDGEPLEFDEQLVGQLLGPVVYRFGLRDAREAGWLPEYALHHHGLGLRPKEEEEYHRLSRRVDDAADALAELGGERSRARQLQARGGDLGLAASAYVTLTARRKDALYRSSERGRVAADLVTRALAEGDRRILLFHERVDDATTLFETLKEALPGVGIKLEHSRLPDRERVGALDAFRSGEAAVLVSVKSLIEGIDVPDADVGISVASSSSVRQRVQSLGRVLRRRFDADAPTKQAEMHLIYMADTVDEVIYQKEDWSDITGEGANHYWRWPLDPELSPEAQDGPPASPRPSEESEWARLGGQAPERPQKWLGSFIGHEYSVDTLGNVTNRWRSTITNPQNVGDLVTSVRGRPGGRFRVTPTHRLVLVTRGDGDGAVFVAGRLAEPFETATPAEGQLELLTDVAGLSPGEAYPGPATDECGSYKLRQKMGGVIERRAPGGGVEFALMDCPSAPELARNAQRVLDSWRSVLNQGIVFGVNQQGHSWYTEGGQNRFLADVPGGFVWPSTEAE
jgi:superfamily II DNA or RNA helicase